MSDGRSGTVARCVKAVSTLGSLSVPAWLAFEFLNDFAFEEFTRRTAQSCLGDGAVGSEIQVGQLAVRLRPCSETVPVRVPCFGEIGPVALDRAGEFAIDRLICRLDHETEQILQVPEMNRAKRFIAVRELIFPSGISPTMQGRHYLGTAPEIDVRVELDPTAAICGICRGHTP